MFFNGDYRKFNPTPRPRVRTKRFELKIPRSFDYGAVVMEAMKELRRGFQPISLEDIGRYAEEYYNIRSEPDCANLIAAIFTMLDRDLIRGVGDRIFMETTVFRQKYKNVFQIYMPAEFYDPNFGFSHCMRNNNNGNLPSRNDVVKPLELSYKQAHSSGSDEACSSPDAVSTPSPSKSFQMKKRIGSGRFKQSSFDSADSAK